FPRYGDERSHLEASVPVFNVMRNSGLFGLRVHAWKTPWLVSSPRWVICHAPRRGKHFGTLLWKCGPDKPSRRRRLLVLRAITTYYNGPRRSQPLNTETTRREWEVEGNTMVVEPNGQPVRRRLADERQAVVHHFSVGGHEGY